MPGISSHGDRKPGDSAPCPGEAKISTLLTLPCRGPLLRCRTRRSCRQNICSFPPKSVYPRVTILLPAACGKAAEGDGCPEGVAIAADRGGEPGELGDPAQPVPDRVRVHEQHPGRGL